MIPDQPPHIVIAPRPDYGLRELPNLEDLVAIAAQISSSDEDPAETARRALCLFNECRTLLIRATKLASMAKHKVTMEELAPRIEEMELLLKQKSEREQIVSLGLDDSLESVKLEDFLNACRPTAKPAWLLEKWRASIRASIQVPIGEGEEGGNDLKTGYEQPQYTDEEVSAGVEAWFEKFREFGVGRNEIIEERDRFLTWLEIDQQQSKDTKAEKSKKARKNLPVCRKVLKKKTLSDSDNDVLKEMGDAELASAIKTLRSKNELGQNGAGLLKAAIEDAKRPKSARPRNSKKRPEV
jgi:hypothetical protein